MVRIRLSAEDRRASILEAATSVFAVHGFKGATTNQIAAAAKVSEALLFQHFATKTALYRAVLRRLIVVQNESLRAAGPPSPDADGLVAMIEQTISTALEREAPPHLEGRRILFGSLISDGAYARLSYHRASRLIAPRIDAALRQARADGDLVGRPLPARNVMAFIEHVVSMMMVASQHERPAADYEGTPGEVAADALWFCARGIGLTPTAIERRRPAPGSSMADKTVTPQRALAES